MQVVKNRIISRIRKIFSVWIFVQIGFVFSANAGDIVITEFFYKSAGNIYEYIEIFNTTSDTINLMDWKIAIDDNIISKNRFILYILSSRYLLVSRCIKFGIILLNSITIFSLFHLSCDLMFSISFKK